MVDPFDGILTPDQIRTLVTVVERGSFSKAATTLGVQQSSITQIVARLEQKLGRRIFNRTASGVVLTLDGEAVLIYARAMVSLGKDLASHLQASKQEAVLKIGLTEDVGRTALPTVLALFARDHGNVRLEVVCAMSDALFERHDRDELDIVVARRRPELSRGEVLWQEGTAWMASADFTLPTTDVIPLVLPPPGSTRATVMAALQQSSRRWRVAFESESLAMLEAALQARIGISAAPDSMLLFDLIHLDGSAMDLPPLPPSIFVLERRLPARSAFAEAFCNLFQTATRLSYGGAPW